MELEVLLDPEKACRQRGCPRSWLWSCTYYHLHLISATSLAKKLGETLSLPKVSIPSSLNEYNSFRAYSACSIKRFLKRSSKYLETMSLNESISYSSIVTEKRTRVKVLSCLKCINSKRISVLMEKRTNIDIDL